MKVAIPTFGARVSPRFDYAETFLVLAMEEQEIVERCLHDASLRSARDRVRWLIAMDIDCVVCGGIDNASADALASAGVCLYSWLAGDIETILASLMMGELHQVN
ncbi:Dinitrogenase iron-molybdenum cofactor [Planctomycetes bacterium CA13]|uniref:Dinitrogenase iron-molybdenum cofactor n=1 Tax=Novipirellula herctigrandis TaxID=2527986 RepID=A0A5C5YVJ6_9BACT|nr:Dinitrogenase iron-molybdenum cofactor [Planctomycetes bacterium CA13]